jgi:hippurate hydrolase
MPPVAEPTADDLRQIRRDLHRIPEVDFDLPKTVAYVTHELEAARDALLAAGEKAEVFSPCTSTVCLWLDRGSEHATAIRSDMDALPVTEETGLPFASEHPGRMHACGHDGHRAMVLGLARHLAGHARELPRSVLLVFQPAEETTGGAKVVCESGVFERLRVDCIFGFHLWPDLPEGQIASRAGALLSASNETTVTFDGRASHIAKASQGRDSLAAGCRFLQDAYAYMRERELEEPCLLKFGRMESGEARNQISAHTRLEGSLRTFSREMGERIRRELPRIASAAAEREGCRAHTHFSEGYPPTRNDAALFSLAADALPELATVEAPLLITEDFAWYQEWIPGLFMLLGTGTGIPLHASTFDFDEDVLMRGLEAYKLLVRVP